MIKRLIPSSLRFSHSGLILGISAALAMQISLLIVSGWQNRHQLNLDGVAYCRIATYYARGQSDLLISGYWSPMISWIMVPWLWLGLDVLVAARAAMLTGAVVFSIGAAALLHALKLPNSAVVVGTWIAVAQTIYWASCIISPDLLMSGLLLLGLAQLLSDNWLRHRRTPIVAGVWCGVAYLAKAVALPISLACMVVVGLLQMYCCRVSFDHVKRALALSVLSLCLVIGPWILTLSVTYGHLTLGTSASIAHSIVGPLDGPRGHPILRSYHKPAAGRITAWEDPSEGFDLGYRSWSPLTSWSNLLHQFIVVGDNFRAIQNILGRFDLLGIGLLVSLSGLFLHRPWRENMAQQRWRWAGVLLMCLTAPYLPVYAEAFRYFYTALPLLLGSWLGMCHWLFNTSLEGRNMIWKLALVAVVPFFVGVVPVREIPQALAGLKHRQVERQLADHLRQAGLCGPIADVGKYPGEMDVGRGLFVAFFLGEPWVGRERRATTEQVRATGAHLAILPRKARVQKAFDIDSKFVSLDSILYSSPAEASRCPLKVYQVLAPGEATVHSED